MKKLTENQDCMFCYLQNFTDLYGYSPSLNEIADHFDFTKAAAQYYIRILEGKGALERIGRKQFKFFTSKQENNTLTL